MTLITIAQSLPFIAVILRANNRPLHLPRVLVDTGSAASIFKTDDLIKIVVQLEPSDRIRSMTGVGGSELVIEKQIDPIEVDQVVVSPFVIQMGTLDYGMALDSILGTDFLLRVGALIDLGKLDLSVGQ